MSDEVFYRLGLQALSRFGSLDGGRVVMLTSAREGEGKTFVAQRLAAALAGQCSQPVALVCAGSRGGEATVGWSELLQAPTLHEAMLSPGAAEGLSVMGPGARPRVQDLFQPEAVKAALQALRQRFALTVIDGPSMSACGALLRQCDGVMVVVDASQTRREVLQGALVGNPVPTDRMMGVVLNRRPQYVPGWFYRRVF